MSRPQNTPRPGPEQYRFLFLACLTSAASMVALVAWLAF